jgi:hypothetical protein
MRLKSLASLATVAALLSLTAACSKSQTSTQAAGSPEDSNPHTEAVPGSSVADRVASSADDPLPADCAPNQVTEQEIRQLEERRRELQAELSAGHPLEDPVYLSRRTHLQLKQLAETETQERALNECLERGRESGLLWQSNCQLAAMMQRRANERLVSESEAYLAKLRTHLPDNHFAVIAAEKDVERLKGLPVNQCKSPTPTQQKSAGTGAGA